MRAKPKLRLARRPGATSTVQLASAPSNDTGSAPISSVAKHFASAEVMGHFESALLREVGRFGLPPKVERRLCCGSQRADRPFRLDSRYFCFALFIGVIVVLLAFTTDFFQIFVGIFGNASSESVPAPIPGAGLQPVNISIAPSAPVSARNVTANPFSGSGTLVEYLNQLQKLTVSVANSLTDFIVENMNALRTKTNKLADAVTLLATNYNALIPFTLQIIAQQNALLDYLIGGDETKTSDWVKYIFAFMVVLAFAVGIFTLTGLVNFLAKNMIVDAVEPALKRMLTPKKTAVSSLSMSAKADLKENVYTFIDGLAEISRSLYANHPSTFDKIQDAIMAGKVMRAGFKILRDNIGLQDADVVAYYVKKLAKVRKANYDENRADINVSDLVVDIQLWLQAFKEWRLPPEMRASILAAVFGVNGAVQELSSRALRESGYWFALLTLPQQCQVLSVLSLSAEHIRPVIFCRRFRRQRRTAAAGAAQGAARLLLPSTAATSGPTSSPVFIQLIHSLINSAYLNTTLLNDNLWNPSILSWQASNTMSAIVLTLLMSASVSFTFGCVLLSLPIWLLDHGSFWESVQGGVTVVLACLYMVTRINRGRSLSQKGLAYVGAIALLAMLAMGAHLMKENLSEVLAENSPYQLKYLEPLVYSVFFFFLPITYFLFQRAHIGPDGQRHALVASLQQSEAYSTLASALDCHSKSHVGTRSSGPALRALAPQAVLALLKQSTQFRLDNNARSFEVLQNILRDNPMALALILPRFKQQLRLQSMADHSLDARQFYAKLFKNFVEQYIAAQDIPSQQGRMAPRGHVQNRGFARWLDKLWAGYQQAGPRRTGVVTAMGEFMLLIAQTLCLSDFNSAYQQQMQSTFVQHVAKWLSNRSFRQVLTDSGIRGKLVTHITQIPTLQGPNPELVAYLYLFQTAIRLHNAAARRRVGFLGCCCGAQIEPRSILQNLDEYDFNNLTCRSLNVHARLVERIQPGATGAAPVTARR